ncbi:hypothetical protein HMPREF9999_02039 [Alloprevotella sp. oral taxon 473 str. F0040]|nr:hypothetical protein HMPREF9999_02039 [Alloprevotella sp. oral taxon 473 str. F0040]
MAICNPFALCQGTGQPIIVGGRGLLVASGVVCRGDVHAPSGLTCTDKWCAVV